MCPPIVSYAEAILKKLEGYYRKGYVTDVTLIAGGIRVPAHRLVLAAASDYLAANLLNEKGEATDPTFTINNVDGNALCVLVHYCYTGVLDLEGEDVEALLCGAKVLQLKGAEEACIQHFSNKMSAENCLEINNIAEKNLCEQLATETRRYVLNNFAKIAQGQEFLSISADKLVTLLSSDDLVAPNEEIVYNAMLRWIEHDPENRNTDKLRLLSCVRTLLLSPQFLMDKVFSLPEHNGEEYNSLILEAFKYHNISKGRITMQSPRSLPRNCYSITLLGMLPKTSFLSFHSYNPGLNEWEEVSCTVSLEGKFMGAARIDKLLFLKSARPNNVVHVVDLDKKELSNIASLKTPRFRPGVVAFHSNLYVAGGMTGEERTPTVEKYCMKTQTWEFVKPMFTPRQTPSVIVILNRFYVIGGWNGVEVLKSVECYFPDSDTWVPCSEMNFRRNGAGVAALDGFIYICGGFQTSKWDSVLAEVEKYDPVQDKWVTLAPLNHARGFLTAFTAKQRIFAVGGTNGKSTFCDIVEVYDPAENKWVVESPMKKPLEWPTIIT